MEKFSLTIIADYVKKRKVKSNRPLKRRNTDAKEKGQVSACWHRYDAKQN